MKRMIVLLCLLATPLATRAAVPDKDLQQVEFVQYPGRQLPLDAMFSNDQGRTIRLGECFRGNPVLLVPGYFRCRMLCEALSDGLLRALQGNGKQVGKDFRVVYVSIDPNEKREEAQARKQTWLQRYGRPGSEEGCDFLSGTPETIAALTEATGFHYRFDPASGEYAHPAGFLVVRPDGRIFRYFFGVSFSAAELDRALDGAAQMAPPSEVEQLVLLCFHYNPLRSRYGGLIVNLVRVLGLGTVGGVALLAVRAERRGRTKPQPETKP